MNELYHHGVLGMKWGVRRYQPYGEGGYTPKEKRQQKRKIALEKKINKAYTKYNKMDSTYNAMLNRRKANEQIVKNQGPISYALYLSRRSTLNEIITLSNMYTSLNKQRKKTEILTNKLASKGYYVEYDEFNKKYILQRSK